MDTLTRVENRIKEIGGWSAYELTETDNSRWEFYFIRHRLDQNRVVDTKTIGITLYTDITDPDGNKLTGKAYGELSATASDGELDKTIKDLIYQAGFVKNPAYTLYGKKQEHVSYDTDAQKEEISKAFIEAAKAVEETCSEDINSYEIFVDIISRDFRNSNGVSCRVSYPSSMLEIVINARREDHEIELYRNFRSGTCDSKRLSEDIAKAMNYGKDRLLAVPTPEGLELPVIFSTDDAIGIYGYFFEKMDAAMKYQKMSDFEIGKPVTERTGGDKITIEALDSLENSSENVPVDKEGSVIKRRFLIKDDIAESFWGSRQYSSYLGIEENSIVTNAKVYGGKDPEEELRKGDYLELVEFSDFQVDPVGGDIAGEIRLGYLHRGGEVTIVTGGSVSGQMQEAAKDMAFSSETVQYDKYVIPRITRLNGLHITGVRQD